MEDDFNPLDFWCPHVIDLILQHLSVNELLGLSEVATGFFDFISKYRRFKENSIIRFDPSKNVTDQQLSIFLKSARRCYENLILEGNAAISKMGIMAKLKPTWKKIRIANMTFNGSVKLQRFMDSVKYSLEEFEMSSVFIFDCDKKVMMSLPNLKRLEMIECNDQLNSFVKRVSFVLSDCKQIEHLTMMYTGMSDDNQRKILIQNPKVKFLKLGEVHDYYFLAMRVCFKLETFQMIFSPEDRFKPRPHFNKFLVGQSEYIKSLEISGWLNADTLVTVFDIKHLNQLKLSKILRSMMRLTNAELYFRMSPSTTLREFIITDDLTVLEQLRQVWLTLMDFAPNLNKFEMHTCRGF